jgi:uncharacterized damage-inducible protein DinB
MRNHDVAVMFAYNYWANHHILDSATRVSAAQFAAPTTLTPRNLRGTLVHALDVEWSWRLRIQGRPPEEWGPDAELRADDFRTVAALAARWRQDEAEMRAYLGELSDAALAAELDLGGNNRFPRWYFLMHLLQHSAQQRTDAATLLTHYGQSPGDFEFLDFADWRRASGGLEDKG